MNNDISHLGDIHLSLALICVRKYSPGHQKQQ